MFKLITLILLSFQAAALQPEPLPEPAPLIGAFGKSIAKIAATGILAGGAGVAAEKVMSPSTPVIDHSPQFTAQLSTPIQQNAEILRSLTEIKSWEAEEVRLINELTKKQDDAKIQTKEFSTDVSQQFQKMIKHQEGALFDIRTWEKEGVRIFNEFVKTHDDFRAQTKDNINNLSQQLQQLTRLNDDTKLQLKEFSTTFSQEVQHRLNNIFNLIISTLCSCIVTLGSVIKLYLYRKRE